MKPDTRKVRRFAVQLPTTFGDIAKKESGTVLNLSAQGCAMKAERIPAISTYVSLQVDLLNGTAPVDIELAGIRWVSGRRCGLEFIRISPEMLVRLRSFVALLENTP
ncbi:MAG: PilZ domain-containing protein [Nitrospira sp.]|nr:MAG: PilZ domain-containing protein [Nitrospira sp.]